MNELQIEKILKEVIQRHVNLKETFVFLFGSRAQEANQPASDYDIGIYAEKKIPLKTLALIKEELENYPIPVDIDLIDFSSVTDDFKKVATRQIQIWNNPKKKNLQQKLLS